MKFTPLFLSGAYLIEPQPQCDERGYFARTFCKQEFSQQGLVVNFLQCSTSFNHRKGLIRGLHYQAAPYQETKLVRCTRGAIFDVMVDCRQDSPTYLKWYGTELTADNGKTLYIPKGFAHGYQVLEDNSEVFYMIDQVYMKEYARSIATHCSEIAVQWKIEQ